MQTTLLGFAIAIILALIAALVGPLFIDWNDYRAEFEARASRLTGLEFQVKGAIDARLLPTPTLVLNGIEFGRPGEAGKVKARVLRIEFELGSLVRGEWKIADASLEGPEFAVGLDRTGKLTWPAPAIGFDLEGVSIQKLNIEDGRAVLADIGSGSRLVLEKFEFRGELRSLAGPVKGEGSFVVGGHHYPYRFSTGRLSEEGVKLRLTVDPIDRPLTAEVDVLVAVDRGTPRFDGTLAFSRPVGRAPSGGGIVEPWRLTSRLKGDSAAVLEQIEFQYGSEERPIRMRGDARLTFGANPRLDGVLASPQIDLDRVLALPEATRRRPLLAIKAFADHFTGGHQFPLPVRLGVTVEQLTLAGSALQRVSGDLKIDGENWDIETLDLRAPGMAQVGLSGRFGALPKGVAFKGRARIEAGDPRAFVAWLTDRPDAQTMATGALQLAGDVTLNSETIAIDWLKAEFDRMNVEGRFAYSWAAEDRPARLHAALNAPEIDVDRIQALAKAMFGDTEFDWPREGTLSLKADLATLAGIDAKRVDVNARIDANGLGIERLTIGDFGGATLAVKGRIDTQSKSPRGAMTVDLDARALDGIVALVDRFSSPAAAELRRLSERIAPLSLRGAISVDPATGAAGTAAKFRLDGRAGTFRVALNGDADGNALSSIENLSSLGAANVKLTTRLETDDARALIELAALDRFMVVEKRPGQLTLTANGPLKGELAVDGQVASGAFNLAAKGTVRLGGDARPSAALALKIANANFRSWRPAAGGKSPDLLPASLTARLALADTKLTLNDLTGTVAGTNFAGTLSLGLSQPMRLDGAVEIGALDLPAALAAALGAPAQGANTLWPSEPFDAGLPTGLTGQIAFKSPRLTLTPRLAARDARGVLRFGDTEFSLQEIDGAIAGGRAAGDVTFVRRVEGLAARGRLHLAGVNAAELLPADAGLSGRLTLDFTAEGAGRSAAALMGSLGGSGTFKLENGRLARLDPSVFEALIRAADQGLPIDAIKVRDWVERALTSNGLAVPVTDGAISVAAGQARLPNTVIRSDKVELAVSGSLNLADTAVDARLVMSGPVGMGGVANTRPEVVIVLKGPIDAAKRTLDVAALSSWLALRAVEQQSQKLDVLEGRAPAASAVVSPPPSDRAPSEIKPARPEASAAGDVRVESDATPLPRPAVRQPPRPNQGRPAPAAPLDLRQFLFGPRS